MLFAIVGVAVAVPAQDLSQDLSKAIAVSESVIRIHVVNPSHVGGGSVGSAVCIAPRRAVTVSHLVFPQVLVTQINTQKGSGARVFKVDAKMDLALLVVPNGACTMIAEPSDVAPSVLQRVVLTGYAYGASDRFSVLGRVASAWLPSAAKFPTPGLWVDLRSANGMSGGGYFDTRGKLVGIHQASLGVDGFRAGADVPMLREFLADVDGVW